MPFNLLVLFSLTYVAVLFGVAFWAERRALSGAGRWLHSPLVYTLSLSIYCTAWTFYGAVGSAARSGFEYATIYLGPTLVFVGWGWILRKLVRIGRQQRVTSVADMISSRYGKSNLLGVIVTLIAVIAATPYIALQLQSVTQAFALFASPAPDGWPHPDRAASAMWVAGGLALFTIVFGTRNLDAKEQHHGIVIAIAVEAVVKLVALLAVGALALWRFDGGLAGLSARISAAGLDGAMPAADRFVALLFLSGAAVICLPRMFQVIVVECADERHVLRASWAFPAYLLGMSLFILPIAAAGLTHPAAGSNPDLFVLTLPLAEGHAGLALLSFLGGFSSATSMVIVEAIALSTMVSNHIVMPIWLALFPGGRAGDGAPMGDLRRVVLGARRLSIAGVLALGYGYYQLSGGSTQLAAMGIVAFAGVAQVLPALLGGIFWRGANRVGAALGLVTGAVVWAYALLLPSLGPDGALGAAIMDHGAFGLPWLRPEALFGTSGMDPLVHGLFWSLLLNTAAFALGSIFTFPGPVERMQGAAFVNVYDTGHAGLLGWTRGRAEPEALLILAQRILGDDAALAFFEQAARTQGKAGYLPDATPDVVADLERRLAGAVGAATAHAMISQIVGRATVSVEDLMAVANETAQIMEHTAELEAQREELTRTARALRDANEKLTQISAQKDAFLSQISHELRTPMTSIRAFSEILLDGDLPAAQVERFGRIIHTEAIRLTRLLDDLLDLSVLEAGAVQLDLTLANLSQLIDRAVQAAGSTRPDRVFALRRDLPSEALFLRTDADRLVQVLINLMSNARKYCDAAQPEIRITVRLRGARVSLDVIDNGSGIAKDQQAIIFEKFARLSDPGRAGGAGLGLAICREIMANLGGSITYLPGQRGAAFRITLPLRHEMRG